MSIYKSVQGRCRLVLPDTLDLGRKTVGDIYRTRPLSKNKVHAMAALIPAMADAGLASAAYHLGPSIAALPAAARYLAPYAPGVVGAAYRAFRGKRKRGSDNGGRSSKKSRRGRKEITHYRGRQGMKVIRREPPKKHSRKKRSLKSRVAELEKDKHYATKTLREATVISLGITKNVCRYNWYHGLLTSEKDAELNGLKMVDHTTGATENVDFRAKTISNQVRFKGQYQKLEVKNASQIPVKCRFYHLVCKQDTSFVPNTTALTSGDDIVSITDADTNPLTYPTDFPLFNEYWKIVKTNEVQINAGDIASMVISRKSEKYDPELDDVANATTYHKGDQGIMIRLVGCLAHDSTDTSKVELGNGQVDVHNYYKYDIRYPSDNNTKFIKTTNDYVTDGVGVPEIVGPNVVDLVENN